MRKSALFGGNVFRSILAYYLEWQLRRELAPLLVENADCEVAVTGRGAPGESAGVSPVAEAKADSKRTPESLPVQSLRTLLKHLGSLTPNQVTLTFEDRSAFSLLAKPTPLRDSAFPRHTIGDHIIVKKRWSAA